jgi:hypothetical protein
MKNRIDKILELEELDPVVELVGVYKQIKQFIAEVTGIRSCNVEEDFFRANVVKEYLKLAQKSLKDIEDLRQREEEWQVKKALLPGGIDIDKMPMLLNAEMLRLKQMISVRDAAVKELAQRKKETTIINEPK